MKIIITGATGSLGAYLTRYFAGKGNEVVAVGRAAAPPKRLLEHAAYVHADITKPFPLPDADVCIHAAALASDKEQKELLFLTNVKGTEHTARAARNCDKFIHVSSSSVYIPEGNPLTEEMRADPEDHRLSEYGRTKILAEEAVVKFSDCRSSYILRPRAIYGPGDKVLLPRILGLYKRGKMLRPGEMNVSLSLTHFENFARATELAIQHNGKMLNIYNVSDGNPQVLYNAVKQILVYLSERAIPEKKIPMALVRSMAFLRLGNISPLFLNTITRNMVLDISKIRNELGYAPVIEFEKALKGIAEWTRSVGGIEVVRRGQAELAWQ